MKTVGKISLRILILLSAAMLVVGALVAISKTGAGAQAFDGHGGPPAEWNGQQGGFQPGGAPANFTGTQARGERRHFDGGRPGGSGMIVLGLIKNLGIIAIVVMLYVGIGSLARRLPRRKLA